MQTRLIISICCLLALGYSTMAQVSISGITKCMNGKPFPGVVVKLQNLSTKTSSYAISGDQGEYNFCNVDSSQHYRISATFTDVIRPPEAGIDVIDLELIQRFLDTGELIPGLGFVAANFSSQEYGVDVRDLNALRAFLLGNIRGREFNSLKPQWILLIDRPSLDYPSTLDNVHPRQDLANLNWFVLKTGDVDGSYCK